MSWLSLWQNKTNACFWPEKERPTPKWILSEIFYPNIVLRKLPSGCARARGQARQHMGAEPLGRAPAQESERGRAARPGYF